MKLFSKHPVISYNGMTSRNIATRAMITKKVLEKYQVFYPYVVHDGERPDTIAHDYYGSSEFDWLVLLSNSIVDVYSEWPLDQAAFDLYMKKKYVEVDQTMRTVKWYTYKGENAARITYKLSESSYNSMDPVERIGWVPVYVFDWEVEQNEAKRNIRLISDHYLPQIESELQVLFK